jgi:Asp-tRNA(Asn)/Glu-tRNA(Gln) amidotransferase A subunit family amidase
MKAPRSLQEVKNSLTAREYSLTKLVEFYLKNIEEKKNLNAFLEVWEKR